MVGAVAGRTRHAEIRKLKQQLVGAVLKCLRQALQQCPDASWRRDAVLQQHAVQLIGLRRAVAHHQLTGAMHMLHMLLLD